MNATDSALIALYCVIAFLVLCIVFCLIAAFCCRERFRCCFQFLNVNQDDVDGGDEAGGKRSKNQVVKIRHDSGASGLHIVASPQPNAGDGGGAHTVAMGFGSRMVRTAAHHAGEVYYGPLMVHLETLQPGLDIFVRIVHTGVSGVVDHGMASPLLLSSTPQQQQQRGGAQPPQSIWESTTPPRPGIASSPIGKHALTTSSPVASGFLLYRDDLCFVEPGTYYILAHTLSSDKSKSDVCQFAYVVSPPESAPAVVVKEGPAEPVIVPRRGEVLTTTLIEIHPQARALMALKPHPSKSSRKKDSSRRSAAPPHAEAGGEADGAGVTHLWYSVDGSFPTTLYTQPFLLGLPQRHVKQAVVRVQAIATDTKGRQSNVVVADLTVVSASYTYFDPSIAPPTLALSAKSSSLYFEPISKETALKCLSKSGTPGSQDPSFQSRVEVRVRFAYGYVDEVRREIAQLSVIEQQRSDRREARHDAFQEPSAVNGGGIYASVLSDIHSQCSGAGEGRNDPPDIRKVQQQQSSVTSAKKGVSTLGGGGGGVSFPETVYEYQGPVALDRDVALIKAWCVLVLAPSRTSTEPTPVVLASGDAVVYDVATQTMIERYGDPSQASLYRQSRLSNHRSAQPLGGGLLPSQGIASYLPVPTMCISCADVEAAFDEPPKGGVILYTLDGTEPRVDDGDTDATGEPSENTTKLYHPHQGGIQFTRGEYNHVQVTARVFLSGRQSGSSSGGGGGSGAEGGGGGNVSFSMAGGGAIDPLANPHGSYRFGHRFSRGFYFQ